MKNNIIPLPQRGTNALPRRGCRPKTAVQKVKEKMDPLTMARVAGVLVEPKCERRKHNMNEPFYQTMMAVELTRETAKDFVLDHAECFAGFVMAYHPNVVIDFIKQCPKELTEFVMAGGLSGGVD